MDAAVPSGSRAAAALSLPEARSEREALADLRVLAGRNRVRRSMIGLGYHGTITPAVIQRNVLENPSWYTAYTPYQPEISQGRLEALINFQTMIRSEEHTSELQSLMRISYAVFCLKKKKNQKTAHKP